MARTVKVNVPAFDVQYQSFRLNDFIERLIVLRDSVPETYREGVEIRFETGTFHDSVELEMEVSYTRRETNAERVLREAEESQRARLKEDRERETLRALKAKYEPNQ